jgi:adenylate cyclase
MTQTRQLAAIMFTDIVGYTALMGNDDRKAFDILSKNRALQKPIIEEFNGRWIKELGDGVMASFNTVADAVYAAIKIQEACNASKEYQLRIGIHLGDVLFENDDVFGDGVNIASRIQSAAKPGSIYISESVHRNISNKKDIQSKFIKEETLKNVKEPVRIYEIVIKNETIAPTENKMKTTSQNSIAVLPFTNMSSDPEQEYFSDGISEEIINMLAQVPGLKVAGRTSSFSFKGKNQDLRIIGEQLSVNYILEGSVRKSGNKIRITAQLIKVADGYHLYSEKFDRELEDIFDIQDEISLAILNAIKIKLLDTEKRNVLKRYTDNPEAYQLYLQARFHVNQYSGAEAFKKGITYYEAAIKVEPEYALAYAGMAWCWLELWFFRFLSAEECLPRWKEVVQRALDLDDKLAESHLALADMKLWYEWDFVNAAVESQKAIEINPNSAEAHINYAWCLVFTGRYAEASEQAAIAYTIDPLSLMNHWFVGWIYFYSGQFEKMIGISRRSIELEPNFFGGHMMLGSVLSVEKQYTTARVELELAVKLNYSFMTLSTLGVLAGDMKDEARSKEIISEMETLGKTQSLSNFDLGQVYTFMGDYDRAAGFFEKAIELREGFVVLARDNIRVRGEKHLNPKIEAILKKVAPLNA